MTETTKHAPNSQPIHLADRLENAKGMEESGALIMEPLTRPEVREIIKALRAQRSGPADSFQNVGFLQRPMRGTVGVVFNQTAEVISLGLHETLEVYIKNAAPQMAQAARPVDPIVESITSARASSEAGKERGK